MLYGKFENAQSRKFALYLSAPRLGTFIGVILYCKLVYSFKFFLFV